MDCRTLAFKQFGEWCEALLNCC